MIVGYKLLDSENNEVQNWGGTWGRCPGVPNPLFLPNDTQIHCPQLNTDYGGYTLVEWEMAEAPVVVPSSVTPRQVRLLLLQQDLLDQVETLIAQRDKASQITWAHALEFHRNDPLLFALATDLNLTEEQIDQFFIAAAQL